MKHDALTQILDALKLRGSVYFHTCFSPPWAVRVPAFGNVARFHMAMRGGCWLAVDGVEKPIRLATGDLAVIPHGAAHILSDEPDRPAAEVDEVVRQSGYTGKARSITAVRTRSWPVNCSVAISNSRKARSIRCSMPCPPSFICPTHRR